MAKPVALRRQGRIDLDDQVRQFLCSTIDFEDVRRAVEVGTGAGWFAWWLAGRIQPRGAVYALDRDKVAIVAASRKPVAILSGPFARLSFVAASAQQLPLPAGFADLLVCRKLLCVVSNVDAAVKDMYRVLRPGGVLVAVEPGTRQEYYDSEEEEYAELCRSLGDAFYRGWARSGVDQRIGLKVPGLFLRHGLSEVMAEGMCQTYLLSDPRRPSEEIAGQLQTEASKHSRRTIQLLIRGGISRHDLREYHRLARHRLARFIANPRAIASSPYTRLSTFIVTVGRKPNRSRGAGVSVGRSDPPRPS